MSAMTAPRPPVRSMIELKKGTFVGVEVYRYGAGVVVVGGGTHDVTREAEGRTIIGGQGFAAFETVAGFDAAKRRAYERAPLAYTRFAGRLGIDDDVRNAPELPEALRAFFGRMLPQLAQSSGHGGGHGGAGVGHHDRALGDGRDGRGYSNGGRR